MIDSLSNLHLDISLWGVSLLKPPAADVLGHVPRHGVSVSQNGSVFGWSGIPKDVHGDSVL